ncbi:MAG: hypothetical protein NVS4B10_20310 [Myxococcales bacterium]
MTARDYVESIALSLSRLRESGLLLSPADAQLALAWHAARVPLSEVLHVLSTGKSRLRGRGGTARGAQPAAVSLQTFAAAVEARARGARKVACTAATQDLAQQLLQATRRTRLPARAAWEALAGRAQNLLAAGADSYWTEAIAALCASLREMPRASALSAGAALRKRLARRPAGMPRRRYRRSLQLQLLSATSDTLDVPPRAFLF